VKACQPPIQNLVLHNLRMRVLRTKRRANTLHQHLRLPEGTGPNIHPFQTPDQHPGDIHTSQILVVVMTMTVVEVVAADDHQRGETRMTIQKWIEKGIALPLVVPLHQQNTTGASLTCLAGTQIPHAYECSANVSQKCTITHLEDETMKRFGMLLVMYLDVHPSPQEHMHISRLLR
jgi:hypothetical protein